MGDAGRHSVAMETGGEVKAGPCDWRPWSPVSSITRAIRTGEAPSSFLGQRGSDNAGIRNRFQKSFGQAAARTAAVIFHPNPGHRYRVDQAPLEFVADHDGRDLARMIHAALESNESRRANDPTINH